MGVGMVPYQQLGYGYGSRDWRTGWVTTGKEVFRMSTVQDEHSTGAPRAQPGEKCTSSHLPPLEK